MQQLIEFASNHLLLVFAFFATLGMLIFTEYTRMFSGVPGLSPYQATQLLNDGDALFLDVRDDKEYKNGHIKGARSVPVNQLDKQMHELEKHKEKSVVVYCDNGMRTSRVTGKLRKLGFTDLHSISGGLVAWEKANLPVVNKS